MKGQQFNIEQLNVGCDRLGIKLNTDQRGKMLTHLEMLSKWNKRLNLTAITDMQKMVVQHLLDSLAIYPFIKIGQLLDIGTGGGFPGLPLAILYPNLKVTLLDSRGKRIEFLRNVCLKLRLNNVSLVNSRIEDYRPQQKFDTLTARAFSSLSDIIEKTRDLQHSNCRLIALKGKFPTEEIELIAPTLRQNIRIEPIEIPFLSAHRHLVLIDF